MIICKNCSKEFIPSKKGKFCCPSCYRKWWQNNLKISNPEKWKKRLELSNTARRKAVRIRRGLPLDHPTLTPQNGKGWKMKAGYKQLLLKDHPNAAKNGYVMEHIVIMAKKIGRPLKKGETVHHINGERADNRLENLELWVNTIRHGQRVEDKIKYAKELLEQYGHTVIINTNSLTSR